MALVSSNYLAWLTYLWVAANTLVKHSSTLIVPRTSVAPHTGQPHVVLPWRSPHWHCWWKTPVMTSISPLLYPFPAKGLEYRSLLPSSCRQCVKTEGWPTKRWRSQEEELVLWWIRWQEATGNVLTSGQILLLIPTIPSYQNKGITSLLDDIFASHLKHLEHLFHQDHSMYQIYLSYHLCLGEQIYQRLNPLEQLPPMLYSPTAQAFLEWTA